MPCHRLDPVAAGQHAVQHDHREIARGRSGDARPRACRACTGSQPRSRTTAATAAGGFGIILDDKDALGAGGGLGFGHGEGSEHDDVGSSTFAPPTGRMPPASPHGSMKTCRVPPPGACDQQHRGFGDLQRFQRRRHRPSGRSPPGCDRPAPDPANRPGELSVTLLDPALIVQHHAQRGQPVAGDPRRGRWWSDRPRGS